jgi:hypothetical protein
VKYLKKKKNYNCMTQKKSENNFFNFEKTDYFYKNLQGDIGGTGDIGVTPLHVLFLPLPFSTATATAGRSAGWIRFL